jgi:site-specific DNA-methyltransferase (adenine-specific)
MQMGLGFIGIEREPKYFDIACRRIEQAIAQGKLFADEPARQPEQMVIA